jgi:acetyl-CoA decarbonylase/synthase complex subunit gamma
VSLPSLDQAFVVEPVQTRAGEIPRISSSLVWADRLGSLKARWGVGRMHYTVEPGLYALGEPDAEAPVLVTANYKMSFDRLREALPGMDAWILVLDTKGINVWCAAGKGTFGTRELVRRIESTGLGRIVKHRDLILPQLAGPGVAAHQVKALSGFRVHYGPVRAADLAAFLEAGMKATPEMRLRSFTTWERVVLIPVELVSTLKWAAVIVPILLILTGLLGPGPFMSNALNHGLLGVLAVLVTITAGAVTTPLLLPWLPGRAFSLKGLGLGLLGAFILLAWGWDDGTTWAGRLEMIGWSLLILAATSYLAMNFTGASTYTSLSGVRKEMRWAVPLQIGAGLTGFLLWLSSLVTA